MSIGRVTAALAGALAFAAFAPASALATDYWASPSGGGGCTSATDACSIDTAVTDANANGDRVILLAGTYNPLGELTIQHTIDFGGIPGQPPPTIVGHPGDDAIEAEAGGTFHDFRVSSTGLNTIDAGDDGGTFDRIFVEASGSAFSACALGVVTVMRNSVCWMHGTAASQQAVDAGSTFNPFTGVFENDDFIATGPNETGFVASANHASSVITATNVIARGTLADVSATTQGMSGVTAAVNLSNSSYATTTLGSHPGGSITSDTAAGNQATAPALVNPSGGDFHELPSSPTIDAGAALGDLGSDDFGGEPRVQPGCLGGAGVIDIGAYELSPPAGVPKCEQFTVGAVKANKKKATASITVTVPGAGDLVLGGAQIKPQRIEPLQARVLQVDLGLTHKARKRLKKHSKLKLTATLTWSPDGGSPVTQNVPVKLKGGTKHGK